MQDTTLVDDLLLRLEPEWGSKKIESLKLIYQLGNEERKQRIEKILNISSRKLLNDNLLNTNVLLPPVTKEECEGRKEVFTGTVCYGKNAQGQHRKLFPLYLNFEDVKNHLLITGLSGTGKTTLGYNLFIELAKKNKRCIVFDWDRTWRNILSLNPKEHPFVKNIHVYTIGRNDISPFAWNMFFCPPPNVSFANWLGIASSKPLQKSLFSGQGVEDYLETEAEQLMTAYKNGVLKLLPNIEDLKVRIQAQQAHARQLLWKQSAERILKELTREPMKEIFGAREPMDITKEILERDGPTIIEMDIETPDHLRVLFQELLLTYFMLYYLHKGEVKKEELRTAIILEEFPNMLPHTEIERKTGGEIIRMLFKEGRKFGLGLIAIAQESSELPNYVTANCKVQAHFACQTKRDIEATASSLFLKRNEIHFIDLIWQGEAIMKVKGRVKNCLVTITPPPIKEKISDEKLKELTKKWQDQS
ncbi:MAG: ATP-binding protein [Desulfobacteraceae bacterium]|nr:ATP-binding protein [Desulfobacteraceae bacterium]